MTCLSAGCFYTTTTSSYYKYLPAYFTEKMLWYTCVVLDLGRQGDSNVCDYVCGTCIALYHVEGFTSRDNLWLVIRASTLHNVIHALISDIYM